MNYRRYTRRNLRNTFFSNLSVTNWLILINVVFFFLAIIVLSFNVDFFEYIALRPSNVLQGKYIWTLVTSMFMHVPGAIPIFSIHLIINMLVLSNLGSLMERIIGRKRFLWFYLLSGLFAGLLFVLLAGLFAGNELGGRIFGGVDAMAVGASGAIFAVAGLFAVMLPKIRFSIIFFPFFSLPGYIMIPAVLFLTGIVSSSTGFPIGNTAHFGGFLAGLVFGSYLRTKYKKKIIMLNKMFSR